MKVLEYFDFYNFPGVVINMHGERSYFLKKIERDTTPNWVVGSFSDKEIELLSPTL